MRYFNEEERMTVADLLVQIGTAVLGSIAIWMLRKISHWKNRTDDAVQLVAEHEGRLRKLEAETGVSPDHEDESGRQVDLDAAVSRSRNR